METNQQRIERTWQKTRHWLTNFDGSAAEVFLTNIPGTELVDGLLSLAKQSPDFRLAVVSGENAEQASTIALTALPQTLAGLAEGKVADLNANFTALLGTLDLDLHFIVHLLRNNLAALEIVWWADQVFTEGTDGWTQFQAVMEYFLGLQVLFHAEMLFIGTENLDRPGPEAIDWIQI